ncbi:MULTISPECIES: TetR/AcrR family transcriptional regulator [unclassified Microbacterium]|uniref:TetR/AcrR family transcriptional regulator n=1 Tax=unclassified Microbacterium TaxID=2609290 RepID=UPI00214AD7DC|nr:MULTISPECIES: TetR/AcrR family transcriptional regulator [unclassified Microbacterium]MCR2810638.1 TetR/AcrR family transcriptional regulator [Microbacterium sp. zg.B185]WIM18175.1 TetR/AcrR family transcriptional regulator [Microbacterium sp. zg-B185]
MTARAARMLPAIAEILRAKGPDGFLLNTIAEELGTSSRMLVYHFGSRDELLGRVMSLVREQTIQELTTPPPASLEEAIDRWWAYYMEHLTDLQLFFHLASRRFEAPEQFEEFAASAIENWSLYFSDSIEAEGGDPERSAGLARMILAALRGLMVDYLISGEKEQVERALGDLRALLASPADRA